MKRNERREHSRRKVIKCALCKMELPDSEVFQTLHKHTSDKACSSCREKFQKAIRPLDQFIFGGNECC